jgi:hypothetical protein
MFERIFLFDFKFTSHILRIVKKSIMFVPSSSLEIKDLFFEKNIENGKMLDLLEDFSISFTFIFREFIQNSINFLKISFFLPSFL